MCEGGLLETSVSGDLTSFPMAQPAQMSLRLPVVREREGIAHNVDFRVASPRRETRVGMSGVTKATLAPIGETVKSRGRTLSRSSGVSALGYWSSEAIKSSTVCSSSSGCRMGSSVLTV